MLRPSLNAKQFEITHYCKQMDKILMQERPRVKICSYNTGKIFVYHTVHYTVVLALLKKTPRIYVHNNIPHRPNSLE